MLIDNYNKFVVTENQTLQVHKVLCALGAILLFFNGTFTT